MRRTRRRPFCNHLKQTWASAGLDEQVLPARISATGNPFYLSPAPALFAVMVGRFITDTTIAPINGAE
ncbi:hypothetical protein CHU95_05325 [Niveispirillum lacus]|uniref:Uncharacterized protein n=1 Tax=Niveispirillum lacus TaxID=1981099 RepID=A0A255Z448_9PROT|nr:hypothetical protein CHU95_05325 [Niveispirillum lacus]